MLESQRVQWKADGLELTVESLKNLNQEAEGSALEG